MFGRHLILEYKYNIYLPLKMNHLTPCLKAVENTGWFSLAFSFKALDIFMTR